MKKQQIRRFLKRNCIKIPFYTALIVGIGFVSHYDRPMQPLQEFEIPSGVYEVWAATAEAAEEPEEQPEPTVQEMIVSACADYGIDSALPLAIATLETGHFKSVPYVEGNNVGGLKEKNPATGKYETSEYSTLEKGVDAFVKCITEEYYAAGLDTPEEICWSYCPDTPEQWAEVVRGLM